MRHSMKMLLAVLLTVMSFLAAQTVWAGGPEPTGGWTISGTIEHIYPEYSTIEIISNEGDIPTTITITGFPFGYLEDVLGIEIEEGDCLTVDYVGVDCKTGTKNIAVALTGYCEDCPTNLGEIENSCSLDSIIVLRDEDLYPVDKSRNGDDDDHYHHQNRPGNGS